MPQLPQLPQALQQLPSSLNIGRPRRGFSHLAHGILIVLLPILGYILVRIDFVALAIFLVFLSKWRMFAVRPRYWMPNIISNGIDILVSISLIVFMANTSEQWWQLFWLANYMGWLVFIKPRSDTLSVSTQAMIGQLIGLSALYLKFGASSIVVLVIGAWAIAYIAARHFLTSFEESHSALIAHIWAYFAASLAYILGHWMIFYGVVAQVVIILATVGYGMAGFYYLDATDKSNNVLVRREMFAIMGAILVLIILLSNWRGVTL